jgi:hypothetical protein
MVSAMTLAPRSTMNSREPSLMTTMNQDGFFWRERTWAI